MKIQLNKYCEKVKRIFLKRKSYFLLLILAILLFVNGFLLYNSLHISPNSDILESSSNSESFFENINPEFNAYFGNKEDESLQWVRFESETSDINRFDPNYREKEKNILSEISEFFKKEEKIGLEMSLSEVKLSETGNETIEEKTGESMNVEDVLGTDDVKTSTELLQTGRNLGEVDSEQNTVKETILNENVWKGVDLEYQILEGIGIKEEIIIRSLESYMAGCEESETGCEYPLNEFVFDLQLDEGVELHQSIVSVRDNPVGTYYFTDSEGSYLAHFLPSFAFDDAGSLTNNVDFSIEETEENGKYKVHVVLDMKWLMDESRVFPVHIDPSIVHDDSGDFDAGELNRTESVTGPKVELGEYENFSSDIYTVGSWYFDETSGSSVEDSSSYANNGTATGTTIVDGKVDKARNYNGSSDYVTVPDNNSLDLTNGLTIEAWIYPEIIDTASYYDKIVCKGYNNTYELSVTEYSNRGLIFRLYIGGTYVSFNSAYLITENTWSHVAATYDGVNVKMYVNGRIIFSQAQTGNIAITTSALLIGDSTDHNHQFDGTIDEVRISNVARSETEIYKSFQITSKKYYGTYISSAIDLTEEVSSIDYIQWIESGVRTGDGETPFSSTNLVGEWNFNEASGTSADNEGTCGASCDGTLTNMTTSGQDAAVMDGWTSNNRRWGAGALMFDGTDACVTLTDSSEYKLQQFSIEVWFMLNEDASSHNTIFGNTDTNSYYGYVLRVNNSTKLQFISLTSTGGALDSVESPFTLEVGRWYYGAVTLDGSSVKLYVDGKLVAEDSSQQTLVYTTTHYPYIGKQAPAAGYLNYFDGVMDSVRFYSRSLTAGEVLSNYNAGDIEFQTSTSSDGTTWEAWKPYSSETQISSMDSVSSSWSWDISGIFAPTLKENESVVKTEGSGSLKLKYLSTVNTSEVLALFHFDETNGDNAGSDLFDATANNKDGEFEGTNIATAVTDGISGKARTFNGTNDYIEIPLGNGFTNVYTTISFWIYPTSWTHQDHTVLFASRSTTTNGILMLVYNQTSIQVDWGGSDYRWNTGYLPPLNQWTNIVLVRSTTGRYLYVNGALKNSTTSIGSSVTADIKFRIGADTISNQYNYQGKIDEFWVSDKIISAEEIAEIYKAGREYYLESTVSTTDLSGNDKVVFSIASENPGTYLSALIGETDYANYLPDTNTVGLWHFEEETEELLQSTDSSLPNVDEGDGSDGSISINSNTDLNTTNKISGRSCADGGDAVNYNVSSLTANTATVSTGSISSGCIVAGDEVLLINLAGTTSSIVNLGKYETLIVESVNNATGVVTFETNKVNYYGDGVSDDTNLGTANETQRVMLQRVPNYKNITVRSSYTLSATAWNGSKGGVLFFRVSGVLNVVGSISAKGLGYRGGAYVGTTYGGGEGEGAAIGTTTDAGHGGNSTNPSTAGVTGVWSGGGGGGKYTTSAGSAGGSGSSNASSSGGGGGGSTRRYNSSYNGYAGGGGGGGHATGGIGATGGGYSVCTGNSGCSGTSSGSGAGGTANVYSSHNRGGGGGGGSSMYYDAELDVLTFGGGGGGGARGQGSSGSYYAGSAGGNGGGIIYISANVVSVTGTITADGDGSSSAGTCGGTGGGGAGGSVKIYSNIADLGNSLITASGGVASTTGGGDGGNGGNGVIALFSSRYFTGATTPAPYYQGRYNGLATGTDIVEGKIGYGRNFDGTNDYVTVKDNNNIDLTTGMTLEAWIYPEVVDTAGSWNRIIAKGAGTAYELCLTEQSGYGLILRLYIGSLQTYYSNVMVQKNQWSYVVATYDGSYVKMYINGQLVFSQSQTGSIATTADDLIIGDWNSFTRKFDGLIDEVRISNIARSAESIRQSYEVAQRSYSITIDFKAKLSSGDLITGSGDTSFVIDGTSYGSSNMGDNLYIGDKIIIKEVVDDTEYIAQGTVTAVTSSTGAVTVSSWDAGSTFPTGGYTVNSTVFKWQVEYFDISGSLSTHRDAVTKIVFKSTSSEYQSNVWIDDIKYTTGYLTDADATGNVLSTLARYIKYKMIFTTTDEDVTPYISQVEVGYSAEVGPSTEDLMRHGKWFNTSGVQQSFWWAN